jgi:hypothetical protein
VIGFEAAKKKNPAWRKSPKKKTGFLSREIKRLRWRKGTRTEIMLSSVRVLRMTCIRSNLFYLPSTTSVRITIVVKVQEGGTTATAHVGVGVSAEELGNLSVLLPC